jgi:hypothetical protein
MWTYWSPEPRDVLVITRRTKKALWVVRRRTLILAGRFYPRIGRPFRVRCVDFRMTVTGQGTSATTLAEVLRKRRAEASGAGLTVVSRLELAARI